MKTKKAKIRSVVLAGAILIAITVCYALCKGDTPQEIKGNPKLPFNYQTELGEAEFWASKSGNYLSMEAHLTLAELDAEKKGADISKESRVIRQKGYEKGIYNAVVEALSWAHGNRLSLMEQWLEDYRACCLKAGWEPDEEIIKKAREIGTAASAQK